MAENKTGSRGARRSGGKKPFVKVERDLYQEVTDKIIESLESGELPWQREQLWDRAGASAVPYNAFSGRSYRGWNHLFLMQVAIENSEGRFDPRFCSFKQAKDKGWNVKKGAKAVPVFFFKKVTLRGANRPEDDASKAKALVDKRNANGGKSGSKDQAEMDQAESEVAGKTIWLLRAYSVFHASQIEGMPELAEVKADWDTSDVARKMRDGMVELGMSFTEGGGSAAWTPATDTLRMPEVGHFVSPKAYDHVLLHEMGHATGHESRLARKVANAFGTSEYAKEELVAEMTSAMLCSQLGVSDDTTRHAQYIESWLDVLKNDKRFLVKAAGMAAAASDYLIDRVPELRAQIVAQRCAEMGDGNQVNLETVFDMDAIAAGQTADFDLEGLDLSEFEITEDSAAFTVSATEQGLDKDPIQSAPEVPVADDDGPVIAGSAITKMQAEKSRSMEVDIGDWMEENVDDISAARQLVSDTPRRGFFSRGMGM